MSIPYVTIFYNCWFLCGQIDIYISLGDIIVKVNDIAIDTYENFMFIIPTTDRPVSLTFMRTTHAAAVSRLVTSQKTKQTSSSTARLPPSPSIREKDLPGSYLSRDPTPTIGNTTPIIRYSHTTSTAATKY